MRAGPGMSRTWSCPTAIDSGDWLVWAILLIRGRENKLYPDYLAAKLTSDRHKNVLFYQGRGDSIKLMQMMQFEKVQSSKSFLLAIANSAFILVTPTWIWPSIMASAMPGAPVA